ncbi:MAG: hypothetical protein AB3N33_05485 [Puniceicoccaceae bacterium]
MDAFVDIDGPVRIGLMALIGLAALVLVGVVLLIGLLRRVLRNRKASSRTPLENQRSPLEVAMERLDRLQAEAEGMAAEPFIVEVSDIVRDYLETTMRIPAKEQTSEEFLQELHTRSGLPDVLQARMPRFLDQCDLVKFARQVLAETQRELLLETASIVVKETDTALSGQAHAEREVESA